MVLFSTLFFSAFAAEPPAAPPVQGPPTADYRTAVLVNPIGPVSAVVASATGTPAIDANLRAIHMPGDAVGFSLQGDYLRARIMDIHVGSATLKAGPRFALRKRGLADWSLTPYASVGYTAVSAAGDHLAHYGVLGLGVDASRTWVWKRFTMDLGLGVYTALPIAYGSPAEVFANERPVSVSPIKPSITWSLGYAF